MNREQLATALTELIDTQDSITHISERGPRQEDELYKLIATRNGYRNDILTAFAKLEKQRDDLLAALMALRHGDGCFCESAFAGPDTYVRHTDECEATQAAIAVAKETA